MADTRKTRRLRRRTGGGPSRSRLGRTAGVLTIVAMLVLGLASTGGARTISTFTEWLANSGFGDGSSSAFGSIGGYYTTTSTTKPSTTSSYHSSTSSTYATTTTTKATTTTTYATTTTSKPTTTTTERRGGEGCTPGYWRQVHHYDSWVGFTPGQDYETVFGVDAVFTATLGQAVKLGGGGEYALARHAVAALLNSTSAGVDYEFTTAEVIEIVQDAYASGDFEDAKDMLADENEEGCSLN